ncbi:chromosome partitioning protein [Lentzea sp. E54]|uniref:chromosome partitioning protein n=1 Tax=Lentzea xerophila TaxID=3435883 RepID=UPI003DA3980F
MTTFSVALAARWPSPARALLVEADGSGGDVGTRFSLAAAPGLVSLAAAVRFSGDPMLPWQHVQALPGGLPVVAAPPDADRARAALSVLADPTTGGDVLRTAASAPEAVVIADCGRIDAGSPALPIVRAADAMVLLTRAHADDLAHLARQLPTIGRWTAHPAMLLVGDGYSPAEVARELGVLPLGRVPDDPRGAAVLCGRPSRVRWARNGPDHSALGRIAHKVATVLGAQQAPAAAGNQARLVPQVPTGVPPSPVPANSLQLATTAAPPQHENTRWGGRAS